MPITALPPAPSRATPSTFSALADAFIAALPTFVTQANLLEASVNAKESEYLSAAASAAIAQAAANFKGAWSSLTGAATVPYSVSHLGRYWMLLSNLANVAAKTPGTDTEWQEIGNVSLMDFQAAVNPRIPSQALDSTASASGVAAVTIADNTNLNMATNNLAPVIKVALSDWTPSSDVVLEQKHDGSNGWILKLLTTGYLRLTINSTNYDSTVTISSVVADGAAAKIEVDATRSSVSAAGSVVFKVNGYQLGASVPITAGAPTTVSNTSPLYILGNGTARYAGRLYFAALWNRAPSSSESVILYNGGIDYADKWGRQAVVYTSDFSSSSGWNLAYGASISGGQLIFAANALNGYATRTITPPVRYQYVAITFTIVSNTSNTYLQIPGTSFSANMFASSSTEINYAPGTYTVYIKCDAADRSVFGFQAKAHITSGEIVIDDVSIVYTGALFALEPEGIQPTGQWLDSSTNKLHGMQAASGVSPVRYKKSGEVRWVNSWTNTHEAQYVGGVNQAVLPANAVIDRIIITLAGVNVQDFILGDGSDGDRWIAITSGIAAGTYEFLKNDPTYPLANTRSDGTNYKVVIDPDTNCTMTATTTVYYSIYE